MSRIVVFVNDDMKVRLVTEDDGLRVLRGTLFNIPTVEAMCAMVRDVIETLKTIPDRVAIFFKSKCQDEMPLTLQHLSCIARLLAEHKSVIKEKVWGTRFLLVATPNTLFQAALNMFHALYTPVRPLLISADLEECLKFEASIRKQFVNKSTVVASSDPTS